MPFKPEYAWFKEEWAQALESGNYKQGRETLLRIFAGRKKPEYCCLGVACVLAGVPTDEERQKKELEEGGYADSYAEVYFGDTKRKSDKFYSVAALPIALRTEFGLTVEEQRTLTVLNDGEFGINSSKSFMEIAKWIRENL